MTEEKTAASRSGTISRINGMKERMIANSPPELLPERALLTSEAYAAYAGEPVVLKRARTLRHILENMTIFIDEGELFAGHPSPQPRSPIVCPELGARWVLADLDKFATRPADAIAITDENKSILKECLEKWQDSSLDAIVSGLISDEAKSAIAEGMITVGAQGTAHGNIAIDNAKLLSLGLRGIIGEIDSKMDGFIPEGAEGRKKLDFWRAAKISCEAVIAFAARYSKLASEIAESTDDPVRRDELLDMSDILKRVPEYPAETFREALQSVWLVYAVLYIEADPHAILLGRFDQYMYPFYKRDMEEGRMTDEEALELVSSIWIKCTAIIKLMDSVTTKTFAGFPLFQNITLAGQGARGEDVSNELTDIVLEAAAIARTPQPSIGFRYHNKIGEATLGKVCDTIKLGLGYPAIMNDNCIIPKHLMRGATLEEARNYCTNCVETDVEGVTDSRPNSGYVNFPKCLLLAMNDGVDPSTGRQVGLKTGHLRDFAGFGDLVAAYRKQMAHFVKLIVDAYDIIDRAHASYAPEPFMSSLLGDCVERGLSRQDGGVRYNFSGIFGVGIASVSDAMAAVRKLCFDLGKVDPDDLIDALRIGFSAPWAEDIKILCKKAPKFGNDDDYADLIARDLAHMFCEEVTKHPCVRGGYYIPELHSVSTHVYFGELTGATPDGRPAGAAFSDGASPVGGSDKNGPTAAVRSMTKIDHQEILQGVLYNQKFSPAMMNSPAALSRLGEYIRTWCDLGGHHIQFNIVSTEKLREAQGNAESNRDLIVRVAGYSAYFVELNENTQNEIIARTEYEEIY
ncbi:MAG: formate C-acetyltransferase/glycerol dehydratase family glycyl radical enzyme [Synergistaceae bacterium]|nr:formate C-acetyltransferase/glycerol dehydratase family glycyl radical enzyme [Synergistaceae bacterium]